MSVYLDCNATTPVEPAVREAVLHWMSEEFGNAGSRTHEFGQRAKAAVQRARAQVAAVVASEEDEVVFTSGATEANNLAILGLETFGRETGRTHIVTSRIEHKAVLEPLQHLAKRGFKISYLPPTSGGYVPANEVLNAISKQTLLVSIMHANNETGVLQPLQEIASGIAGSEIFFHVDAAQGFGKEIESLPRLRVHRGS